MSYTTSLFGRVSQVLVTLTVLPVIASVFLSVNVAAQSTQNITQIVVANSTTTTLEKLVIAASLDGTLAGTGPFTVFAPNDSAFNKLDAATLTTLQDPANKTLLADILKYHVVSGNVSSTTAKTLTTANSLQGDAIGISVVSGNLTLNGAAKVITPDVTASNGVVHIIDTVILSSSLSTRLIAATSTNSTVRTGGFNQTNMIWLATGLVILAGVSVVAIKFSPIAARIRR